MKLTTSEAVRASTEIDVGGAMSSRCKRISKSVREFIRSARKILSELKGFLEDLAVILVTIWGLLHVARVLFVLAK
jgi:hypothetical protein